MRSNSRLAVLIGLALVCSVPANAVITNVTSADLFGCDVLAVPAVVVEIGNAPPFPAGEQLNSAPLGSSPAFSPCPFPASFDQPEIPNQRVSITNLQDLAYTHVWYVGDPETSYSNFDGVVNRGLAFHIDNVGLNRPLVSESLIANNIWEPGETWVFVIADYFSNPPAGGGLPHSFNTIDVGQLGGLPSTGSIIGIPAPEPSTGLLVTAGLLGLRARRRGRA